jgi:hypothetical protein
MFASFPENLPERQRVLAIGLAIALVVVVFELVRRRKLREEYAVLWFVTASVVLLLAIDLRVLHWLQTLVHADAPVSVLFFGALLFLMLVSLQFSIRLSRLTSRNKNLTQRLALLEDELRALRGRPAAGQELREQRVREPAPKDQDVIA